MFSFKELSKVLGMLCKLIEKVAKDLPKLIKSMLYVYMCVYVYIHQ